MVESNVCNLWPKLMGSCMGFPVKPEHMYALPMPIVEACSWRQRASLGSV